MSAAYYAGTRGFLAHILGHARTRKLRANAHYGASRKHEHAPEPAREPEAYRGGSLPREPVATMDAVSAYPPELTTRARLLADPMSGVRKLYRDE